MSLYGLDESVRAQLKLERFSSADFSTKKFIEQLSRSQQMSEGRDGSIESRPLDPKPYIRTFEAVAVELERLLEIATHQEETASQAAAQLVEELNLGVVDLAGNVDQAVADVRRLDEFVSELSRQAAPAGDALDALHRRHLHVSRARLLVGMYLGFWKRGGAPPELARLWQSQTPGDRRKCAQLVGQLQTMARKIGDQRVEAIVDKYAEQLETAMVAAFQEAYHVFDLSGMKESAVIADQFNGGTSVVQAYVNQHDFFMQVGKQQLDRGLEEFVKSLADPRSAFKTFRKAVTQLVAEIGDVLVQETQVVIRVFPQPVRVLSAFLQRVFAQRVQGMVMRYLQEAAEQPRLVGVRVLYVCYSQIKSLTDALRDTWAQQQFELSVYDQGALALVVDASFVDTFALVLDEYFDNELASLRQITQDALGTSSSRNSETPTSPVTAQSTEDRWARAAARLRLGSRTVDDSPEPDADVENATNADSMTISIEVVQRVLAAFAEAIARQQILRPPSYVSHDAIALYNLLVVELGGGYIDKVLQSCCAKARRQDGRTPPNWDFLDCAKAATRALSLFSAFVKTALLALVSESESGPANSKGSSSAEVAWDMVEKLNEYVGGVQENCCQLIEQAVNIASLRTANLWSKQRKRDYVDIAKGASESSTTYTIMKELSSLGQRASVALDAANRNRLLASVASQFANAWLAHISHFSVSLEGGRLLSRDAAEFEHLVVQEWGISEAGDRFATLRTITKLYAVDASLLPSLLRDSHLAGLRQAKLRSYVSQRTDYAQLRYF